MLVHITSLYAALLALVWFALFGAVGRLRSKYNVSLGDGGHPDLVVANRRHMNFAETVPLALFLIYLVDENGGAAGWVHTLGIVLVAARIIHPFGIRVDKMNTPARFVGAGGSVFVIMASAITLLWQCFRG